MLPPIPPLAQVFTCALLRSWTTGITGTKFKETLGYNYDRNIKQQTFGDNSTYSIRYDFLYDDLSRLTDATSSSISGSYGANDAYGCHYDYDKQGNATKITTNGTRWVDGPRRIGLPTVKILSNIAYDNLTFAYNGNQLKKVSDAADVSTNSITEQFLDFANADVEYAYNANGAMTKDLNKGISSIQYNLLNLPQQIDILSPLAEARNAYSYSADGVKLRVVKKYNSNFNTSPIIGSAVNLSSMNVTKTTDYVGNKIFENNVLDRIFVDGGYIKNGVYYFYETDHLGDNRTVINQSGAVVERNDYYPFGMQMAHNQLVNQASGSDNKRKFGNKELDVMGGLNLYDSQARWYDPCIPVLPTVDPKCEKYCNWSPYAYCMDNPLNAIDPDGRDYLLIINRNKSGEIIGLTIQARIYVTGANASAKRASELNKLADKTFAPRTINGVNISFNISYQYAKEPPKLAAGDNILKFENEEGRSNVVGHRGESPDGARFRQFAGNTGTIYGNASNATVMHETGHLLGMPDRYDDVEIPGWSELHSETHQGFDKDLMADRTLKLQKFHYEQYLNKAKAFPAYKVVKGYLKIEYTSDGKKLITPYEKGGTHTRSPYWVGSSNRE